MNTTLDTSHSQKQLNFDLLEIEELLKTIDSGFNASESNTPEFDLEEFLLRLRILMKKSLRRETGVRCRYLPSLS